MTMSKSKRYNWPELHVQVVHNILVVEKVGIVCNTFGKALVILFVYDQTKLTECMGQNACNFVFKITRLLLYVVLVSMVASSAIRLLKNS